MRRMRWIGKTNTMTMLYAALQEWTRVSSVISPAKVGPTFHERNAAFHRIAVLPRQQVAKVAVLSNHKLGLLLGTANLLPKQGAKGGRHHNSSGDKSSDPRKYDRYLRIVGGSGCSAPFQGKSLGLMDSSQPKNLAMPPHA
jgi:hypothetical protein